MYVCVCKCDIYICGLLLLLVKLKILFEDRISLENYVEQACNDRYQAALALVGASLSHPVTPLA